MIETELRKLMETRAEQMPVDAPLVARAQARSHRIAVRQRIVVAAAATFVAAAAVPVTVQVLMPHRAALPVGQPAARGDFLVNGPDLTPTFPMTPTYLPAGVKRQPTMGHEPGIFSAAYEAE